MKKETKQKLKAFFAAQLYKNGDAYSPAYSELTGGDLVGFSLERIGDIIDSFCEEDVQ